MQYFRLSLLSRVYEGCRFNKRKTHKIGGQMGINDEEQVRKLTIELSDIENTLKFGFLFLGGILMLAISKPPLSGENLIIVGAPLVLGGLGLMGTLLLDIGLAAIYTAKKFMPEERG